MGIHFNYKRDNRHGWLLCAAMITVTLSLMAASSMVYRYYETDYAILSLIDFFGIEILQVFVLNLPVLSCTILLRSLQKRFNVLNCLLRFTITILLITKTGDFQCLICFYFVLVVENRDGILSENSLQLSVSVRKADSIDTTKFIGRQHSSLTDIMDQINFCYSFQVLYFSIDTLL